MIEPYERVVNLGKVGKSEVKAYIRNRVDICSQILMLSAESVVVAVLAEQRNDKDEH